MRSGFLLLEFFKLLKFISASLGLPRAPRGPAGFFRNCVNSPRAPQLARGTLEAGLICLTFGVRTTVPGVPQKSFGTPGTGLFLAVRVSDPRAPKGSRGDTFEQQLEFPGPARE